MTTITTPSEIINTSVIERNSISNSNRLETALKNITDGNKYATRAELRASGDSRQYDEMQRTILNAKGNNRTAEITGRKLQNEQRVLKEINEVVVRFKKDLPQTSLAAGTTQEKADKALTEIARILRKRDGAGEFIFGGSKRDTDPLVKANLTDAGNTNVIEGLITNNYTKTSSNNSTISVSSNHQVRESFLYAGHPTIAKTIGYINMVKAGDKTELEVETARIEEETARRDLTVKVDLEIEKVNAAKTANNKDISDAEKIDKERFRLNAVEAVGKANDLKISYLADIFVKQIANSVSQKIFDNIR